MRKADNLPPSCAIFTKSGNLNFLEPSGPLRACNRTALPFTYNNYILILYIPMQLRPLEGGDLSLKCLQGLKFMC